jgi:hypothetical protein
MRYIAIATIAAALIAGPASAAEKLLFFDDFNRAELGPKWETSDARRGVGVQSKIVDGVLSVKTDPKGNHGAVIATYLNFRDAAIQYRFMLTGPGGFNFSFNDKEYKPVWAGHIARVRITPNLITIQDDKTGTFDLKVRERRLDPAQKAEVDKYLKTKAKLIKANLALNQWHTAEVILKGDTLSVAIDGKAVGSFSSEGIGHATKRHIAFTTGPDEVRFDDVRVTSLDSK